jgi:hypothetical protein
MVSVVPLPKFEVGDFVVLDLVMLYWVIPLLSVKGLGVYHISMVQ